MLEGYTRKRTCLMIFVLVIVIGVMMTSGANLNAGEGKTIQASGIDIYYEISGSGPYLILIEGLGVGIWLWEKQVPELSQHFTTVAYDNRGAGKSAKPEGPYTISLMADDLAALIEALNIPKANILGASMGGMIAQEFALRYPEKVDRLILVATTAGGPEHVPMSQETLARFLDLSGEPRELIRKRLVLAYSEAFMQGEEVEHLIDLRLKNPQPKHAYEAQMVAGATFNRSPEIENIQAPCLIAAGEKDLLVPVENARKLAQKIPGSQLKIYPGLGHQFFVEDAATFNRDVIAFLTEEK